VRVDHGRFDVLVPQEFLHGANIIAIGQQMGCEAVAARFDIMLYLMDNDTASRY
jgi:hypothetical protein